MIHEYSNDNEINIEVNPSSQSSIHEDPNSSKYPALLSAEQKAAQLINKFGTSDIITEEDGEYMLSKSFIVNSQNQLIEGISSRHDSKYIRESMISLNDLQISPSVDKEMEDQSLNDIVEIKSCSPKEEGVRKNFAHEIIDI